MNVRQRSLLLSLLVPVLLGAFSFSEIGSGAPPAAPTRETVKRSSAERALAPKPFAPEKLLRAFKGNREDVRHRMLDDAEQHLADPQLAATLWQVIESALKTPQVPESLLRAVHLFGRLEEEETSPRLIALLSAADPRVVQIATDLLAERRPPAALEKLMALKERPTYRTSYGFRHAVVSAVARYNQPASVGFLVNAISSSNGQLKYEIVRQLVRLTGENFGGKGDEWRTWWDARRDGFQVVSGTKVTGPMAWDYDVPQFFGTPIYALRVVFVIDKSRSMQSSVDGVTRLDDAEKELEAAIRKLPEEAWFEIIAYNDFEQPYAGKLVQATPAQKSGAVQFIYSLVAERKTDIYDTLSDALQVDPNVEAILFLSDGEPNVGRFVDCPTILQKITQQNAAQRTSINTIGIDARGAPEEFLKKLASDNFGQFRSIR